MPITFACAVRNAVVWAVIRRRLRAAVGGSTPLSDCERQQYGSFPAATESGQPLPTPLPNVEKAGGKALEHSEIALLWAASHLFFTFFVIRDAAEGAVERVETSSRQDMASGSSDAAEQPGTSSGEDCSVIGP